MNNMTQRPKPTCISELSADPGNPRDIQADAAAGLGVSLRKFGDISGITFNRKTGELATGHQRVEKLKQLHGDDLEIVYNEKIDTATGEEYRGFIRTADGHEYGIRIVNWSRQMQRAANLAANNSEIQGDYTDVLRDRLLEVREDDQTLYDSLLLDRLADKSDSDSQESAATATDGDVGSDELTEKRDELSRKWDTQVGQTWVISGKSEHRLVIGDCTHETASAAVKNGLEFSTPVCILTDPPYCSGGFQEGTKAAGSVGTTKKGAPKIANDTLSTRGYCALLKQMLERYPVGLAYVFTDWQMWVNLFDVVESSGFGVRNMVVWNKGSAGMGRGWRSQHEIVLCGSKVTAPFEPSKAQGNVIDCKRSGNKNHVTEKPVDLLCAILDVTVSQVIIDPFAGSGSTLIACDRMGRKSHNCELDPKWASVILERASLTGCEVSPLVE